MAMFRSSDRRLILAGALLATGWMLSGTAAQATSTSETSSDGQGWSIRNGNVKNGAVHTPAIRLAGPDHSASVFQDFRWVRAHGARGSTPGR
jgi:hypothetical protein